MKEFNVTGICVPSEHYMVDISGKINEILKLVHDQQYFTINRARQYGKTTTLNQLKKSLSQDNEYICVSTSFESMDPHDFDTPSNFCKMFLRKIYDALKFANVSAGYARKWRAKKWFGADISSFESLSRHITKMCKGKKVVLIIDEVDKSTNNKLFLHFLGMLRAKYLNRQAKTDFTFHSVILAGISDIKNLKLKMINDGLHAPMAEEGRIFNSPWNIAASFDVDMSFSPAEISTMLISYEQDHKTGMDISLIADEIYRHTSGYPFLVSRICKYIDEMPDGRWTVAGVEGAVELILGEKNTLFDDMSKNMENYKNLYDYMYELVIQGDYKPYNTDNPTCNLADMYGYIKKGRNGSEKAVVSNKIFNTRLSYYFVAKDLDNKRDGLRRPGVIYQDVIKDGKFDMEMCIRKFAEHYMEIYAEVDEGFLERHGRLLFLSYLKPLLNGQGFYHIESQFTDLRRMDIVVDFETQQFIVELKIWRGAACMENAYDQLLGYMKSKNAKDGYLLTFDFRKNANKQPKSEWVVFEGVRVFEVVV